MIKKSYSSFEIIKMLEKAGFVLDRVKGSHHIYINPTTRKRTVVPHPKKDLPFGTAKSILLQSGIEQDVALGMEMDTGLERNACRRMNGQPGPAADQRGNAIK